MGAIALAIVKEVKGIVRVRPLLGTEKEAEA
jgi:hypothetical protein